MDRPAIGSRMTTVIGAVVIIAACATARGLLLPLAMAALVSLFLAPFVNRLDRWGVRRGAAVGLVVFSVFLVVLSFGWLVSRQLPEITEQLPTYRRNISEKIRSLGPAGDVVHRLTTAFEEMSQEVTFSARGRNGRFPSTSDAPAAATPGPAVGATMLYVLESLGSTLVVLILVVFLLIYQSDLRDRVIHLAGHGQVRLTTQTMGQAAQNVSRYLLMQTAVNAGYGVLVALGLLAFGVPNPMLWGLVAAIFRFVPYAGPWLGALMPLFLSLAVFDTWTRPVLLLASWIVLEALIANVGEPWLYGERTGLSPLAVILAAIFWSWLWGGLGLILSVPLTVTLVVLGRNFSQLSFLNTLLGSEAAIPPPAQLYHRLLGRGADEAADLVDAYQKGKPLLEICDALLLPTLALAATDQAQGSLDRELEAKLQAGVRSLAEDLGERAAAPSDAPAAPAGLSVLCVPASNESDGIIAEMLAGILGERGFKVETLAPGLSVGEKLAELGKRAPDLVIVSALPPGALLPSRYLYKRIRKAHPDLEVLVGLWSRSVTAPELQERIGTDPRSHFAVSLSDALEQTLQLAPGLALRKSVPVA